MPRGWQGPPQASVPTAQRHAVAAAVRSCGRASAQPPRPGPGPPVILHATSVSWFALQPSRKVSNGFDQVLFDRTQRNSQLPRNLSLGDTLKTREDEHVAHAFRHLPKCYDEELELLLPSVQAFRGQVTQCMDRIVV